MNGHFVKGNEAGHKLPAKCDVAKRLFFAFDAIAQARSAG